MDAALRFYRAYSKHLMDQMGMQRSKADSCLFYLYDELGRIALVAVCHVDDTLLVGTPERIKIFKEQMKFRFNLKELGQMKKHLGIHYDWTRDKEGKPIVIARMRDLTNEIIKVTEQHLGRTIKEQDTPAKPGEVLELTDEEVVAEKVYRTIVGKIMYLTHKVMLEGANAARELSKFFIKPQKLHWKAVEHFVGYLKKEKDNIKLTYRRPLELKFMAVADSNYATDKQTRRSVSGGIYTIGGTIIGWTSKAQGHTTLSSSEAEYAALSSAGQEMRFITNILDKIEGAKKPGVILGDNEGALALVKNRQVGARTKHIDTRHHFLRDLWEDGTLRVAYIPSEDNEADICTKNINAKLHFKHRGRIRDNKLWFNKLLDSSTTKREDVVMQEGNQES